MYGSSDTTKRKTAGESTAGRLLERSLNYLRSAMPKKLWPHFESTSIPKSAYRDLVAQLSIRDRAMVLLAGSTGLRRSEFIAVTWADVNITTLEVNVLRSCVRNRFGETKTECSRRPVPLHTFVLEALLMWRE